MRITVQVKPGSKKPGIEKKKDCWVIRVRERPVENLANLAVIQAIAQELGVPRSQVKILQGNTSKTKVVEVPD
ncbi:MAG: DUF167 domain-containing protein [Leptospirales bacterium]|nr:DUF167 domain-containing protein [Leptospirales bacterium]